MKLSNVLSGGRSTPQALPNFDSTTVFVRATASYLRGEAFPRLGMISPAAKPLTPILNALPRSVRTTGYTWGGASEGVSPDDLGEIDIESFREWVVDQYPKRGYPAVIVGSSNGAAVFLAAALGIPFLPQTFLLPIRRSMGPDDIREDIHWGIQHASAFLEANPNVSLHQMHDPNQDRLMVRKLAYFRTKVRSLGSAYQSFLETVLEPGGTIIVLECDYEWPAIELGDRHSFQLGGLGGLEPREYYEGSDRIAHFLAEQGADDRRWDVPEPDGEVPEAEWGFDDALREDIERVAEQRRYEIRRLCFDDPRDLSPFVADLYRDRYDRRGYDSNRLFVQSFALVEPWWTLRTGSVPYWSAFNTQPDADFVESYLDTAEPYDDVRANLFSHGVESAGLASIDRWRQVLERGRVQNGFVGVDTEEYPYDVKTHIRYHADLPDEIRDRYPHPSSMAIDRFDSAASEMQGSYSIDWREG
ncbi:hypothetical protein OB919_19250 [Halobacteria archaeon AArc-curdl1]|uniref:Uncharacterized protein n=1 Tax=Natronosalvus hydrolyticus TaxID=2979988 RepID=A0AAP3E9H2_9EURY|nr:hypothetical protein [Halobacteria archaeon AArc-curdl1]